jgi:3-hydroxyacyl-[acyl-carrier-protein] dehydratase
MTMWYKWSLENPAAATEMKAHIRVPADSPWFDGHFPGAPVLPGVAQLGMVHDVLCRALNRELSVRRVSRVRFKRMIGPDQAVLVTIRTLDAKGGHSFRISGDEGLVCSGQIELAMEHRMDDPR